MTSLTLKTVKLLCDRANIARKELIEEAQKLADLCDDPHVAPEQKEIARSELDGLIRKIEERVETSRRLRPVDPE